MKKENIDRVNDIVNMIDSKQKDIASLRLASFASITRLNGNAFIEVLIAHPTCSRGFLAEELGRSVVNSSGSK